MRNSACVVTLTLVIVVATFVSLPNVAFSRHVRRSKHHGTHQLVTRQKSQTQGNIGGEIVKEEYYRWVRRPAPGGPDTLQVAGSSLPDCAHACGSCSPCRLVMVSFVCSTLQEAETCPMAYKCMCRNKSFPVP